MTEQHKTALKSLSSVMGSTLQEATLRLVVYLAAAAVVMTIITKLVM